MTINENITKQMYLDVFFRSSKISNTKEYEEAVLVSCYPLYAVYKENRFDRYDNALLLKRILDYTETSSCPIIHPKYRIELQSLANINQISKHVKLDILNRMVRDLNSNFTNEQLISLCCLLAFISENTGDLGEFTQRELMYLDEFVSIKDIGLSSTIFYNDSYRIRNRFLLVLANAMDYKTNDIDCWLNFIINNLGIISKRILYQLFLKCKPEGVEVDSSKIRSIFKYYTR